MLEANPCLYHRKNRQVSDASNRMQFHLSKFTFTSQNCGLETISAFARIFLFLTFVMDHSRYALTFVSCPELLEHPIKNTQHFTTCILARNANNSSKEKHSLTRKLVGYRNWRQRWCKKEGNKVLGKDK